jgi:hypothetical protein
MALIGNGLLSNMDEKYCGDAKKRNKIKNLHLIGMENL